MLSNDFDPDVDPLTATLLTPPGSASGFFFAFDGVFSYDPAPGFTGTDSFTYQVSDGEATDTATVTITVGAGGQAPTAVEDAYTTAEDTDLNVEPPRGVLANDTDPEGDPLTATVATGPEHGRLVLTPNGGLLYDPDPGFNGPDQFTYTASDGVTTSEPGTVLLAVTAVDSPPVGTPEFFATPEDQPLSVNAPGLLANDSDPDGDPLTAVLLTDAAHGAVTLGDDGGFFSVPAPNYNGPDQFTYAAEGAAVLSAPVTVPLLVVPVDDPPAAVPAVRPQRRRSTAGVPAADESQDSGSSKPEECRWYRNTVDIRMLSASTLASCLPG